MKKSAYIIALTCIVGAFFIPSAFSAGDKLITNLEKNAMPSDGSEKTSEPAKKAIPGSVKSHTLSLGLGQTFLYSKLSDLGDNKITGELYYSYAASYSFDFLANFHFSSHEINQNKVKLLGLAMGIKAKFFQFDSFTPFAIAGLGFYRPQVTRVVNGTPNESEGKIVLGNHFGGGVDLTLNDRVTVGLMIHYHNPFDVDQPNGRGGQVEGSYLKLLMTAGYTF